jgi:hypothetical protein
MPPYSEPRFIDHLGHHSHCPLVTGSSDPRNCGNKDLLVLEAVEEHSQKPGCEIFEKRYAIYEAAVDFIAVMMRDGKPSQEAQNAFLAGTQGSKLLFGK